MASDPVLTSDVFRMRRSFFATRLFRYFGLRRVPYIVGVLLVFMGLGFLVDWRFFILGLMTVMIVVPFIFAILYYNHGLRPECFQNVMPHNVSLANNVLVVSMLIKDEEIGESKERELREKKEEKEEKYEKGERWVEMRYGMERFGRVNIGTDWVELPIDSPAVGFVWLTDEAFGSQQRLADFVEEFIRIKKETCGY